MVDFHGYWFFSSAIIVFFLRGMNKNVLAKVQTIMNTTVINRYREH